MRRILLILLILSDCFWFSWLLLFLPVLAACQEVPYAFLPWELAPGSEETVWGAGGVYLRHRDNPGVAMFLWLYEWNLFDAVEKGEHTHGTVLPNRVISANQEEASVSSAGIEFRFKAVEDGATVRADHHQPF